MWMRLAMMVFLGGLPGCTSLRERGDQAMQRGDFLAAADFYDHAMRTQPNDSRLFMRRTEARRARLGQLFGENQEARRRNDRPRALASLAALLAQRDAWSTPLEERLQPALAAEVGMAGNDIAIEVDYQTNTVGPLAGEALLATYAPLLAHRDFGGRAEPIRSKVREVGRAACKVLAADADTPFWTWTVDRYCLHWGEAGKIGVVALPALRRMLQITGGVEGLGAGEVEELHRALDRAFRASAWYAPTGGEGLGVQLSGSVAIGFTSRTVEQVTSYTKEVAYSATETTQESYQEPYRETEHYTVDVPYSDTETRTELCERCQRADGSCEKYSCSKTVSVTKHRSESRTRTVTKHRTAWRTVTRPVTRHRTETYPYSYEATEVTGRYATELSLLVVEPEGRSELTGVGAAARFADARSGIQHDVTFEPAGVTPRRADLPSRATVIATERDELARRLAGALDERFARRFCAAATYDREAAATCAYLDHANAPAGVHAALRVRFGADEPFLGAVLAR